MDSGEKSVGRTTKGPLSVPHSDIWKAYSREESKRREKLREAFQQLQAVLPKDRLGQKPSKVETIKLAHD